MHHHFDSISCEIGRVRFSITTARRFLKLMGTLRIHQHAIQSVHVRYDQEEYYNKSDGGSRLGFWTTSEPQLENEIVELERLVPRARSARVWPPSPVTAAEDALAAARWAVKAVRLLSPSARATLGSGGVGGAIAPAFADVSALLESAVRR